MPCYPRLRLSRYGELSWNVADDPSDRYCEPRATEYEQKTNYDMLSSPLKVCYICCDVTNYGAVQAAIRESETLQGRPVDCIVCNAGLSAPGRLLSIVWLPAREFSLFSVARDVSVRRTRRLLESRIQTHIPEGLFGCLLRLSSRVLPKVF